jgi:hypothetical protein
LRRKKPEGKTPPRRPRDKREDIKINVDQIG